MNVAFDAFQGELDPLVVHSCERTSINESGLRSFSAFFEDEASSARI